MISDVIGGAADKANEMVVDDAKKTVDDLITLLAGPERRPPDIEKEKAQFVQAEDLSTPGGGDPSVPVRPADAGKGEPVKPSAFDLPKSIEFIHFGRVHRDAARTFHAATLTDDTKPLESGALPGRALYYRASLERESVVLAGLARSVSLALAEKEQKEGALGDLMQAAADLLGGAPGTAGSAASADMNPFVEKVQKAWDAINKSDIKYADLHESGIKLHEVRANLIRYLLEQLGKGPEGAAPPENKGILSDLPLLGEVPLPGPVGQIVGMFRKVGGKLHDVQNALIFGLTVAMQPAIDSACHAISIDALREGKSPIYPIWFAPPPSAAESAEAPFADLGVDDPLAGDLKKIEALNKVNEAVAGAFDSANSAINDATEKPREIIDFLSKPVGPAPGNRWLDMAFQAGTGEKTLLGGSEKLGEIAVTAFFGAVTDDVPGFMQGFVQDFVGYVFAVCVEFLRSVYRVLTAIGPSQVVSSQELVAAGSAHVLTHLIDFVTAKLGLDEILEQLSIPIPPAPSIPGINWPTGTLSAAPVAAELKKLLVDEVSPYLAPVVEYAMNGLATRLNAQRVWAGGSAMTMEAHLAQLPTELALMFRNLFKPLWDFITDTCMDVVSDVVAKALGPVAGAVGIAGDALGTASGFIADAQKKAKELEAFAKNVEDKADNLIKQLSSVKVGIGETGDLSDIEKAANDLVGAATSDPFSEGGAGGGSGGPRGAPVFPSNRKPEGKGVKIEPAELAAVAPKLVWDKAKPAEAAKAGAAASGGAA